MPVLKDKAASASCVSHLCTMLFDFLLILLILLDYICYLETTHEKVFRSATDLAIISAIARRIVFFPLKEQP